MQVSLLSPSDSALARNRSGGLLIPTHGDSSGSSKRDETEELRDRVRRDDRHDAQAAATLVPTRSSEVISDAERNVEFSSRAFRRQVARDGAAERFQDDRRAFRQALNDAREKGTQNNLQRDGGAKAQLDGKSDAKTNAQAPAGHAGKPSTAPGADAAGTATTPNTTRTPTAQTADSTAAARGSARAGGDAAPSIATGAAANASVARTHGAQIVQNAVAVGRAVSSVAGQAARPSGTAGAKGAVTAQPGGSPTRGPAKSGSFAALRAREAQAAERADRQTNIERMVRVIRSRINGERSHTVMRLDPPELGRVRLQMDLRGSALLLRVEPTTELAHRLLTEDVSKLRDSLEASGIQLERIEVRPPTLAPEAGEHSLSQDADTRDETSDGSAHADAEHPAEQGKDSHLAPPVETTGGEDDPESATESLVNVVA